MRSLRTTTVILNQQEQDIFVIPIINNNGKIVQHLFAHKNALKYILNKCLAAPPSTVAVRLASVSADIVSVTHFNLSITFPTSHEKIMKH